MTITEFLQARVAEDEEQARRSVGPMSDDWRIVESWREGVAARVLAECEAKRAIIKWHESWPVLVEQPPVFETADGADPMSMAMRMSWQMAWLTTKEYVARFGTEPPSTPILRSLAAVYADHPDYREEWKL